MWQKKEKRGGDSNINEHQEIGNINMNWRRLETEIGRGSQNEHGRYSKEVASKNRAEQMSRMAARIRKERNVGTDNTNGSMRVCRDTETEHRSNIRVNMCYRTTYDAFRTKKELIIVKNWHKLRSQRPAGDTRHNNLRQFASIKLNKSLDAFKMVCKWSSCTV